MKDTYDIVWNPDRKRYDVTHTRLRGATTVGYSVLDVSSYSEACQIARHEHPRISLPKYPVIVGEPIRLGRA